MTISSVTSCKKAISVFKEDSIQIPTQKSQILCFRPDGLVKHPDGYQSATSVRTTWQYRPNAHRSFKLFKVASIRTSQQCTRTLISVQQEIEFPSHTQIW
jgi:hypothetical protein